MSEEAAAAAASQLQDQSGGAGDKSKRNSGLFALLRWFKPSTSRESIDSASRSSSCDSLTSLRSAGTVASFSFVPPNDYAQDRPQKVVPVGPETDTYRARLRQRNDRREKDKDLTLRKKYKLFFNRERQEEGQIQEEENSKSLPLLPRTTEEEGEKIHRRTNSESSKVKRAGAYLHVKGKRRAPQPPGSRRSAESSSSTTSLRRKKRLAPPPPQTSPDPPPTDQDVLCNDSLKLDHGILKPAKADVHKQSENTPRTGSVEAPVSPRPWYKRNTAKESKKESKQEPPLERLPDVQFARNSTLDLTLEDAILAKEEGKKKEEKRKSALTFLTNISELDREASEIVKSKDFDRSDIPSAMPEFMRPKDNKNTDSWASPKRRSAKDLIARFNAITNVTRVSVFGASQKDNKYFGKQVSLDETRQRQEALLESHKKRIEEIDRKKEERSSPLMKSESANAIKKPETPKMERKSWKCPKCNLENEYWRIICHVCSTIKPYFDDFSSNKPEVKSVSPMVVKKDPQPQSSPERVLERSRTQIGFSALANYNKTDNDEHKEKDGTTKKEEKEKLKKMLIEMKNSLPKRKSHIIMKQNSRQSIIIENPDEIKAETKTDDKAAAKTDEINPSAAVEKTQEEKVAEILIGTKTTIYENIKMRKTETPKPLKVSSSAQTTSVVKKIVPEGAISALVERNAKNFELMRPKDFEDIYADKNGKSAARVYANLAQNDELSLFFNVPKNFADIKNNISKAAGNNTDTIEINRLLRRLETAIAKGEMTEAASFAKELAQLKVNCSVIRQKPVDKEKVQKNVFQIEMYVEDKVSHRGPFSIDVNENQTVADLKQQIEREFEIPANVQRWILGKELVTDDLTTLKHHKITEGCPVFLYLVAPDAKPNVQDAGPSPKQMPTDLPSSSKTNDEKKVDDNKIVQVNGIQLIRKPSKEEDVLKQDTKVKQHCPKIVNLIPKSLEVKANKNEAIAKLEDPKEVKVIEVKIHEPKPELKAIKIKEEIKIESNKPVQIKEEIQIETKPLPQVAHSSTSSNLKPPKASLDEDFEDDNSKTLKPTKEWECHLCTLLNPISSNVCAVCAAVKLTKAPPKRSLKRKAPQPQASKDHTYLQLVNLDNADLVESVEAFECVVCFLEVPPKEGVTLRECLHQFCKNCLANHIEYCEEAEVKCPYRDDDYSCNIALQDREVKALVTGDVYEQYLAKSVAQAENRMEKTFHCKSPDCKGWCIFEDNVNEFRCPVCKKTNCLTCQAIHMGLNCKQYQEKTLMDSEVDDNAKRTREMLEGMVEKGEALACPTCQFNGRMQGLPGWPDYDANFRNRIKPENISKTVVLMKKWGCDWVRCSVCRTEICWVTRGPRWGPEGKGDVSAGCKCGLNGVKCHPKCNYCH